jgi:molecular chaperone GrpE
MTGASDDELIRPDAERGVEGERDTGASAEAAAETAAEAAETAADTDAAGGGDAPVGELRDELSELDAVIQERDQLKDIAIRVQADFENFRKRAAAKSAADVERATAHMAEALLPVLDAAEAAYLSHPEEVAPLLNSMLTELKKLGLETLDLDGKPFDPEVAEAISHEPGDSGDVVVAEVIRSGYRWKGRTLRPALVRTRG